MASDYEREIHSYNFNECGECGSYACLGHPELALESADAMKAGTEAHPPWLTREEALEEAYNMAAEGFARSFDLSPRPPSRVGNYGNNGGIITEDW